MLATPRRTPASPVQSASPASKAVCTRLGPTIIDSTEANPLSPDSSSPSMLAPTFRSHLYCDLLTDLATGHIYPIYSKDRSVEELVSKVSIFFALHPSWQNQYDNVDRFIRLDAERNYRSDAFLQITASFGYRRERAPERDKHANGVAERTVGIIAVKTNVAMLNPFPSVPTKYWDLAMTYASDTHSFNPNSRINYSPYHYITGQHIDVTQLHPFFARCFAHIPPCERNSKIGDLRAYKAHFIGYDYTSVLKKSYQVIEVDADGRYGKVLSLQVSYVCF